MQRTLILGGGYGGTLAAIRMAQRGVPVTLVDAGSGLVDRIRLHQVAAGDEVAPTPYSQLFRGLPVTFSRARVLGIDRDRRIVSTMAGDLPYDRLVYPLGTTIGGPEHTLTLAGPAAARVVRERLSSARRVIVVGWWPHGHRADGRDCRTLFKVDRDPRGGERAPPQSPAHLRVARGPWRRGLRTLPRATGR